MSFVQVHGEHDIVDVQVTIQSRASFGSPSSWFSWSGSPFSHVRNITHLVSLKKVNMLL